MSNGLKLGRTRATISPSHDCDSFTVVWFEGRCQEAKAFADLVDGKVHTNSNVQSLAKGEAKILHLSGEKRISYLRTNETIKEFDMTLDSVAIENRDAKRLLRGVPNRKPHATTQPKSCSTSRSERSRKRLMRCSRRTGPRD